MSLRETETKSIRGFLKSHSDKLTGTVFDYGCGQQPYRDIVEAAGGRYYGWDSPGYDGSVVTETVGKLWGRHDAVICTQVIQYVENLHEFIEDIQQHMREEAWLLMTGPTNWPLVEHDDKWRLTPAGVVTLLGDSGFGYVEVHPRHHIEHGGEQWLCGWEAVAR